RLRGPGIEERGVLARGLGEPGDERRLGEREVAHVLAKVILGRGLHAVAVVPEVDPVQVQVEDLLLAQRLLQAQREDRLPGLALEAGGPAALGRLREALRRDEDRLGGLLREGRSALDAA